MIRSRSALLVLPAAVLLLGACSGDKDASQTDVEEQVEEQLTEVGFVRSPADIDDPIEVSADDAANVADCVGNTLFDPDEFTPDERNAIASSTDADPPPDDLVVRTEALVHDCYDQEVSTAGPVQQTDEETDEDTTSEEG